MPEPHLNPDAADRAIDSDKALEQALERVRQEARTRARAQKKARDEAASVEQKTKRRPVADQPRQHKPVDRRQNADRRAKPRADAKDRRVSIGGSQHESMQSRPILLVGLVAAIVAALGVVSIQFIHATTPPLEGFTASKDRDPSAATTTGDTPEFNQPVAASLMRTQGWILPSRIQTIDPALARIRQAEAGGLPPEIALVPSLEMDVDPQQELAALAASVEGELVEPELLPPPPLPPAFGGAAFGRAGFGASSDTTIAGDGDRGFKTGPRLALPPMQAFGGANNASGPASTDPFAGGIATASPTSPETPTEGAANTAITPAPSMLENINREQSRPPQTVQPARQASKPPPAPAPADPIRSAPSLARLQEDRCARLGFFARISCKDDIKTQYCEGRWNEQPGCTRFTTVNNF